MLAIVVLLVVVAAALLLVRLLQDRADLRGMSDHHRAMDALHKVADAPHEDRPVSRKPAAPTAAAPILTTPWPSAPHRRRMPAWRRPALVAGLVALIATAIAGIGTLSGPHRTRVATTTHRSATTVPAKTGTSAPKQPPASQAPTPLQPAAEQTTALQPAKADARTADYIVGTAPFSVVVTAGGPCWLQVRTATGQVLFTGTLAPGQIQTFSGTDLRLRLGAAGNVTLQVNGSSLVVPVKTPDPYSVRVAQTA